MKTPPRGSCKLSVLTIAIHMAISGGTIQPAYAVSNDIIVNDGSNQTINTPMSDTNNRIYVYDGTLNYISPEKSVVTLITTGSKGKSGTLNISNGAKLTFPLAYNKIYSVNIGGMNSNTIDDMSAFQGGTGTLNISGPGSQLDVTSATISVGGQGGTGYLNITNGGVLNHTSVNNGYQGLYIGSFGGFQGTHTEGHVLVDGPGSQLNINNDQLAVGAFSDGSLDIHNGAHVTLTDGNVIVGYGKSSGRVLLTDTDSQLSTNQNTTVYTGDIIVADNATLSSLKIILTRDSQVIYGGSRLIIGASQEDAAATAGQVNASSISMSGGDSRFETSLILNHTDNDYHLGANIDNINSVANNEEIKALHGTTYLEGDNTRYRGRLNISQPAKIIVAEQRNLGESVITDNGELRLQSQGNWDFVNAISGTGILTADTGGNHFNFSSGAPGSTFAGTLNLENTAFNLDGINTAAMAQSTLLAGSNSLTQVGKGTQSIGGLAFNGGTLIYHEVSPGDTTSDSFIETTGDLNLTGTGQIQITESDIFENTTQHPDTTAALMQQDDGDILIQLAGSQGTVTGDAGNLTAVDRNGNAMSAAATTSITQNGEKVAHGLYGWRLTSGQNNDGLYVNYGLTEVELLTQGNNALTLNAEGNSGNAADLSAKVTGTGDLRIDTDTDVSLSNSANSYTGATWVATGGLTMGNNNVLGQTRLLSLADGTHLDMNGYAQTLQNIKTETGSTLNFNQGSLTVNNGTVAGHMTGAGSLTVTNGQLTVSSDNTGMSASTTIANSGVIRMLASQALGSGDISNQGTLLLGQDDTPANTRAAWPAAYQTGNLTNTGTVVLGHNNAEGQAVAGTTLTVNGNYAGEGGHLRFNTSLGNDSSVTDKLMITGDTSGNTGVSVTNAGGTGDTTLNGIELIHVGGQSDGTFAQEGRIVAGAYDYSLVRGQGSHAGNWYLTSQISPVTPPVDPSEPPVTPPVTPSEPPVTPPVTPPAEGEHVNRPEGGSYIANLAAANTLFNTRLHDRSGETEYVDALTGEKNVTSLWLRQVGGHNSWHDGSGQLKTQSNSYVAQLGGDVARWSTDGVNRGHIGLMAGYANSHSNTHSSVTGYGSRGSVNGYSTGIYGTWFARDADKTGLYVDSWLQYSWFNNHVNGEKLASESYKSRGLTASLETGYTLKMGEFTGSRGTRSEWFIQPQAQATWMGVKAGKHHEDNGTRVNSEGDGNIQTRLGMRAYLKSHHAMDEGKDRTFEPFIEANWLHNTRSYSAKMDDVRISQAGARNIGEVKVGVEGQINPRLNLWGNVGTQMGDEGYHDSTAMLGVKVNF